MAAAKAAIFSRREHDRHAPLALFLPLLPLPRPVHVDQVVVEGELCGIIVIHDWLAVGQPVWSIGHVPDLMLCREQCGQELIEIILFPVLLCRYRDVRFVAVKNNAAAFHNRIHHIAILFSLRNRHP